MYRGLAVVAMAPMDVKARKATGKRMGFRLNRKEDEHPSFFLADWKGVFNFSHGGVLIFGDFTD